MHAYEFLILKYAFIYDILTGGSLELGCNVSKVSAEILSVSCDSNRAPTVFTCSVDGSPPRNCELIDQDS